ncbi:hypothetical protein HMPREF0201_02304 [Cedecea davisae DSM 4568]|uniref:Uncharacterized protein n=1 Tax=Cedecea davisae DSM 4568 TaxID=566551 RepID=S3JV99_9ENTR|nr:hypothetical protein HMPREF0201_02304 [Cedecea davisae DSM 4568]
MELPGAAKESDRRERSITNLAEVISPGYSRLCTAVDDSGHFQRCFICSHRTGERLRGVTVTPLSTRTPGEINRRKR